MTEPFQQSGISGEEWSDCSPGEIQDIVNSLRHRRRQQQFSQVAAVGTSLVLLFAVTFFSIRGFSGTPDGQVHKMGCKELVQNAEEYVAGRLSNLMENRVEHHLSRCKHCRHYVDNLKFRSDVEGSNSPILQNEEQKSFELSQKPAHISDHRILIASVFLTFYL